MKLMYFNDYRLGVLKADHVVDVTAVVQAIPHTGPGDLMNGLIARWADYRGPIEQAVAAGQGVPLAQVTLRAPLPARSGRDSRPSARSARSSGRPARCAEWPGPRP